jgi:hypothetical protein
MEMINSNVLIAMAALGFLATVLLGFGFYKLWDLHDQLSRLRKEVKAQGRKIQELEQNQSGLKHQFVNIASSTNKSETSRLSERLRQLEETQATFEASKAPRQADYYFSTSPNSNPIISQDQSSYTNRGIYQGSYGGYSSPPYPEESHLDSSTHTSYQQPEPAYAFLVQSYNENPASLERNATGVSETETSLDRRRRDASLRQVTLRRANSHSYWVISGSDDSYWLVPKSGLRLNYMNIDTFQALFSFQGEPESLPHLVKPAKVSYVTSTGEWELVECGEIQFVK